MLSSIGLPRIELPRILQDAQDLTIIGRSEENKDNLIYAVKPSIDYQRNLYEESLIDEDHPAFQGHWKFNESNGITGSSTNLALRFDARVLRQQKLWVPSFLEAKALEETGQLENGFRRNYGVLVYDENEPNQQHAKSLIEQANNLQLPLIIPFKALDYTTENDQINFSLVENPRGIISGNEAKKQIQSLNYKANSGVHSLMRGSGYWAGNDNLLSNSCPANKIDWICGEATREVLMHAYQNLSTREFDNPIREHKRKISELEQEKDKKQIAFQRRLTSFD